MGLNPALIRTPDEFRVTFVHELLHLFYRATLNDDTFMNETFIEQEAQEIATHYIPFVDDLIAEFPEVDSFYRDL